MDAPDDLNFFGWASHHANGLFDAATTIPDAIIRTTRADEALGYAYDKSVPDGVKETISNLKEAHNNWKQNNPNTAEVGEFGINVGAAAVGARAKPPKGVGGGSDDFADYVKSNVEESRKARETSNFDKHVQQERELKTGLDFNHFVGGDVSSSGKVTGGHSLTKGDVRVVQQTSAPDQNGVYQATVEIRTPNGNWEVKTGRSGRPMINHSMFPAHWDEARIRSEVTSAWESRQVDGDKWEGRSDSGVLIRGYTTPKGTAFPVYDE